MNIESTDVDDDSQGEQVWPAPAKSCFRCHWPSGTKSSGLYLL